MLEELLREAMAASTRAQAKTSDYGDPDGKKFPIMTAASVLAAARLLGRAKGYDDAKRGAVKARIIRIAKRKGFPLPKAWSAKKEAIEDMSDQMVSDAIQAALMCETDPDMDGDDDSDDWESQPRVRHVFPLANPPYFVFQMGWDGDWYKRTYTINDDAEAALGDDAQEVRPSLSFVPVSGDDDDKQEGFVIEFTDAHNEPKLAMTPVAITESNVPKTGSFREVLESTTFREATVGDDDMFHITGTAINPGVNRSGTRVYPKETLAKAVTLFKGAKMYIDHPSAMDEKIRPERTIRDIGGKIEEAWINPKGGIDYRAVVIDPQLREKLSLMNKAGALDAMGTSVNYMGTATPVAHEGRTLDNIDEFSTLHSLDFVTEAGAWGDIARMESLRGAGGVPQETEKETDVATVEELAKVVEGLAGTVGGLVARTAKSETRSEIRAMLTESKLPKISQDAILEQFKDAEKLDGVAEAIAMHQALVKGLTESLAPKKGAAPPQREVRRVDRVVVGMGDTTESAEEGDDEKNLPAPSLEAFTKDFARMMGGADKAEAFYRQFA